MKISVIVVSQNRPVWLARCLRAIRQLDHPSFEVVIVADAQSLDAVETSDCKTISFDIQNISAARNVGIRHAAGDICAFIDDDAVPEPMWLQHFETAFESTQADALVGFVRGRNGISFQSKMATVDIEAETHVQPTKGDMPFVPKLATGHALKLVGTNMAFKRSLLERLAGFDEAFAFYLDDTDISLRLANQGMVAAVAPLAEVHHGFAASARRTKLRRPTNLYDIGRSSAVFFRRHDTPGTSKLFDRMLQREKQRLIRHLVSGTCEPSDVRKTLQTLRDGWVDGLAAQLPNFPANLAQDADFSLTTPIESGHKVLFSRLLKRSRTLKIAAELSSNGHRCSVISLSLTPVRHRLRYTEQGVWVQTGGQFGRSKRTDKRIRWCRFTKRKNEEIRRVAKQRGI